jgi:UrcA family protein
MMLAAAALGASALPAAAQEMEDNGRAVEIRFGDLNLTRADDIRQLDKRIVNAAGRVCRDEQRFAFQKCVAAAVGRTQAPVATAIAAAESRARLASADTAPATATTLMVGN